MVKCITAVSKEWCFIHKNVGPSDKKIEMFGVWWISKALMDVQHQERTCQHKFPPKFIETEKPGFSVVIWSEMNCILDRFWTWEWRKKIEIVVIQSTVG